MRRKHWALSALVFAASLLFLLYSQQFYSQRKEAPQIAALPSSQEPSQNIILLANEDYFPFLRQHFRKAQTRILGTIYLFKMTSHRENEPAELLQELIAAKKRNVDVDIVIEISTDNKEANEANLQAVELLRNADIKVRLDHTRVTTHSKVFVIDDRYCFVGSHNMTHAALSMNQELSLYIDSLQLAGQITSFVRQIPLSQPR